MAPFKQGGSEKFHGYVKELIHKIHEVEEMLLSGDDRHLEDLKDIAEMIEQYVNEAQGHKFEPMQYRDVQGRQGQQGQPSNYYPEYPQDPRRSGDVRGHLGYYPYAYPVYPLYNERGGHDGRGSGQGYSNDKYDRRR